MIPESNELGLANLIDQLCDQFELAWQSASPISIESMINEHSTVERSAILRALLEIEIELKLKSRQRISSREYRERFPDDEALVKQVFNELQVKHSKAQNHQRHLDFRCRSNHQPEPKTPGG